MARVVKEYDDRFNEFLETAQTLFFTQGYEQTSVQDIIKQIGVAKGTFYHYFDSKVELLEAVVKRNRTNLLESVVLPIANHSEWDALTKFRQFFSGLNNWKLLNHNIILQMLRMLYKDENVLLRLKLTDVSRLTMAPPLAEIIEQGVMEGVFDVRFAQETAELILRICEVPSHEFVAALIDGHYDAARLEIITREFDVFNRSIERVLGMTNHTVTLVSEADLLDWLAIVEQVSVDKAVSS